MFKALLLTKTDDAPLSAAVTDLDDDRLPAGDVLVRGRDHFDACPQCGHAPLSSQVQPDLAASVGQIANMLEKWLKR